MYKNAYKKDIRFLNDQEEMKLTPYGMYTHILLTVTYRVGNG